jgi:hypothetical protein
VKRWKRVMKNKDPEMKEFAETEEQMNIEMVK